MAKKPVTSGERIFDTLNIVFMVLVFLVTVYPFYITLVISLNDPLDAMAGGLFLFVRKFSLLNYQNFFQNSAIIMATIVTVSRTVIGTVCAVIFTGAFAYGLSKNYLLGRKLFVTIMLIPMYIGGGLIPYYLVLRALGLMNNFLVFILPLMFSSYNAILLMTFFKGVSKEIEDSAKIDGSSDIGIFVKIIIPISAPVLATIALFNAVMQWQSWFDAALFGGPNLKTLQLILVNLIRTANIDLNIFTQTEKEKALKNVNIESLKLTAMIITTLPIVLAYPFLQKYFIKGMMIGSLKG